MEQLYNLIDAHSSIIVKSISREIDFPELMTAISSRLTFLVVERDEKV